MIIEKDGSCKEPIQKVFSAAAESFQVTFYECAIEALDNLERTDFEVAFVCDPLDETSGLEILRQIHQIKYGLPVVLMARRGSDGLAMGIHELNAAGLIIKARGYCDLLPNAALSALKHQAFISSQIMGPSNPRRIYDSILGACADLLKINSSSIMILNQRTGVLETKAYRGLSWNYANRAGLRPGDGPEGLAVSEGRPVRSQYLPSDPRKLFNEEARLEGVRSALSVPFRIDSDQAVVNLYSHRFDRFKKTDERLASRLVKLSGLALETLGLYVRERHIAETLQRSHFPDIDNRFDGWEVAHRYKVSMEEALLGGDFYDLFALPDGRRAMVVADVSGKGINAATQTAMVKYTIRGYALEDPDPASVLRRTNHAWHAFSRTDHFVTIFYGLIDPIRHTIDFCSAGHPPPLFFSNRLNQVINISEVHPPIGVWDYETEFTTDTINFSAGDTLLVYTDGLTDCRLDGRLHGKLFGQDNLECLFSECAGGRNVENAADHILNRVLQYSQGTMKDDAAFFVIRFLGPDRSESRPDMSFAPEVR